MNGQGSKGLGCALGKANVREALLLRAVQDILDTIGNIMKRKFVNGKVPEASRVGRAVDRLFGVLVAAIVAKLVAVSELVVCAESWRTYPNIEALLNKLKSQASLLVRLADPDLRVHEQAVVQVDDALPDGVGAARVDAAAFLAASPLQAVQAEEVAVLGLDNVLLRLVAPDAAQLDKVGGVADGIRYAWDKVSVRTEME